MSLYIMTNLYMEGKYVYIWTVSSFLSWKCTLYMYIYLYCSISNFLDCNLANWTISGTWNAFCILYCICCLDFSANWILSATCTVSDT